MENQQEKKKKKFLFNKAKNFAMMNPITILGFGIN